MAKERRAQAMGDRMPDQKALPVLQDRSSGHLRLKNAN